ncbi:MAG: hypothetical protein AAF527_04640 [Pseudomonadota bacterium]
MVESFVADVMSILTTVFLSGDLVSTILAFVVAIGAAFTMNRFGQIWGVSLSALVIYGLLNLALGVFRVAGTDQPMTIGQKIEASWSRFMGMTAGGLLGYFLAFLIVIVVVFLIRSAIKRT